MIMPSQQRKEGELPVDEALRAANELYEASGGDLSGQKPEYAPRERAPSVREQNALRRKIARNRHLTWKRHQIFERQAEKIGQSKNLYRSKRR